ncbi:MAG: hypothetical protein ABW275_04310 [Hansschlegelia sp.]
MLILTTALAVVAATVLARLSTQAPRPVPIRVRDRNEAPRAPRR